MSTFLPKVSHLRGLWLNSLIGRVNREKWLKIQLKKNKSTVTRSGYCWTYWSPVEVNRAACTLAPCIELSSVKYWASSISVNTNEPPGNASCTYSAKANASFLKVVGSPTLKSTLTSGLVSSCLKMLSSLEPARVARGHLQAVRWQSLTPGHCRGEKFDGAFPGDPQWDLSQAHSLAQMQRS